MSSCTSWLLWPWSSASFSRSWTWTTPRRSRYFIAPMQSFGKKSSSIHRPWTSRKKKKRKKKHFLTTTTAESYRFYELEVLMTALILIYIYSLERQDLNKWESGVVVSIPIETRGLFYFPEMVLFFSFSASPTCSSSVATKSELVWFCWIRSAT